MDYGVCVTLIFGIRLDVIHIESSSTSSTNISTNSSSTISSNNYNKSEYFWLVDCCASILLTSNLMFLPILGAILFTCRLQKDHNFSTWKLKIDALKNKVEINNSAKTFKSVDSFFIICFHSG